MLRDKFAMAAMQGMVSTISSQTELDRLRGWANQNGMTLSEFIAKDAYKQADAMMKERGNTQKPDDENGGCEGSHLDKCMKTNYPSGT